MTALRKAQVITSSKGFAAMLFSIAASPVLNKAGVSFQTITIGYGILYTILAAVQIPTGVWADVFGTKRATVLGGLCQTLAMVLLGLGSIHSWQILAGFALYGLGTSLLTRSIAALTFESTRNEDRENFNSNRFVSVTEKAAVASYILASFFVGFLAEYMGRSSLLIGGVFFLGTSLFVAFRFSELSGKRTQETIQKEFIVRIKESYSIIVKSAELKALLPIRMLHQVESILGVMWLPWVQQLGGGSAKWYSVVATGSYIFRYLVNHELSKCPRPESYMRRVTLSLLLMAVGCSICVVADNVWMALFGIWTMAGARGAFLPAVQAIQHEELTDSVRTTGLSALNFSIDAMVAVSYFGAAMVIEKLTVASAWSISAISFLTASAIGVIVWRTNQRLIFSQSAQTNV
ncbi:MAG: MFS transporter [Pseudobdellovibrionaceae bacterium]